MRPTLEERFFSKVRQQGDCWSFTSVGAEGYGQFHVNRLPKLAHRWAYEYLVGPIPEGLHLDHLCRNRACVNPAHLDPVPRAVNIRRGISFAAENAAKTHCLRGHPFDAENTYGHGGKRLCRACQAERCRRYEAKRRARRANT